MFFKKGVLRNFAKFTGKHLYQSLFLNKVSGLRPATLLKKRLRYRCFPVNFAKFLRTPPVAASVISRKYRRQKKFWKTVRPFLSDKLISTLEISLVDHDEADKGWSPNCACNIKRILAN